jgi:hypothetical protein
VGGIIHLFHKKYLLTPTTGQAVEIEQ